VFSHRRIRENPPSGGGSVYSESTVADERLVKQSEKLLEHFSWRGLAMVEFKIDRATGTAYLMEINGRVWGSLQLAIDAGVDFPSLLVAAACGEQPRAAAPYRVGVRLRSWWPDVDHLLARVRHSPERLSLPPDAPDRSSVIRDFFRWRRGDRMETFRFHDPAPFFRDSAEWIRRRVGRG
jgi:predicted ATP-grasp superfamily ATP-dependent carboligase